MGFNPSQVGLVGERITGKFREPRPNKCPHKGLDISSSGTPKAFTAGIYGAVIAPVGGPWGTISVSPFHAPSTIVQYLHCSAIHIGVGALVAPWTVLGLTGKTAPPGTHITGIHLHVQVLAPGTGNVACWNNKNFVDPETWSTPELMSGDWTASWTQIITDTVSDRQEEVLHLSGTSIGSSMAIEKTSDIINSYNGDAWSCEASWPDGTVIGRTSNGLQVDQASGTCTCTNGTCTTEDSGGELRLINANSLYGNWFGEGPLEYTRGGAFTKLRKRKNKKTVTRKAQSKGTRPFNKKMIISSSGDQHSVISSGRKRVSIEEWYGVLPDEIF